MTEKERRILLRILGYTGREKTASLKMIGAGAAIGGLAGGYKAHNKNLENPNLNVDDKVYNSSMSTAKGLGAGVAAGIGASAGISAGKKMIKKLPFIKASEFIDNLSMIKSSSMKVPTDEEIEEMNNGGRGIVHGVGYKETPRPSYECLEPMNQEPVSQGRSLNEGLEGGL